MNTMVELGISFRVRELGADECLARAVELMQWAKPAFEHAAGEVDEVEAVKLCAMGNAVAFAGETNGTLSALLIAQLIQFPLKKVCLVLAYSGRMVDFYEANVWLEDWATRQGCDEMRGYGQEGPMRLARRHGYSEIYRVYVKPLKGNKDELH